MRRVHYRYALGKKVRTYPTAVWFATRRIHRALAAFLVLTLLAALGISMDSPLAQSKLANYSVAGQNYNICDETAQYLTSPWTYDGLSSGSQTYDVADYQALPGYGTTLPPLPSYIVNEGPTTEAAVIFAPGGTVNNPQYFYPGTPLVYYFEGGNYTNLALSAVTGDEFIGGSTASFSGPMFDDQNNAGGINAQNGTFDFSGGHSTVVSATSGNNFFTINSTIPGYINYVTFSDGTTYQISSVSGNQINLYNNLSNSETAGSTVWGSQMQPIAYTTASASQGGTSVTLSSSSFPLMQYGNIRIGDDNYRVTGIAGAQTGYTVSVAGLDTNVGANTPIYYDGLAGNVTVSYLNIAHDSHNTTGTIYTGAGWTVTHNDIHDGYDNTSGTPTKGLGVAIYGGDQGTVEYNCLSKMGDYGVNIFGTNNLFDYNEIYESNYLQDPGCGCSGGGKWWGTLNADIVDNAFINDSPGQGGPVWLDNGNTGTNITGNFFDMSYGSAISSETGFNLNVTGNLFEDGGWGGGTGACGGTNCDGAVNINSSGGFQVPGSRYENEVNISSNNFIDNWEGIDIWQAGGRSCENSGEGNPDAPYCSGGFPNTAETPAGGQFYFSHNTDSSRGGDQSLAQDAPAAPGSPNETILVSGSEAINDQIGFSDPASTTTSAGTNVTTFDPTGSTGPSSFTVGSTSGFPTSGQLRVGTSGAWSDGNESWTGAILAYTGISTCSGSPCFTGVSFVRGTGTLQGPVLQVQPYTVNSETCYANDCAVNVSPGLTTSVSAGSEVSQSGTCQLFATSASTPSSPKNSNAPASYWDGCQWEARDITVMSNNFVVQPSLMNSMIPLNGGTTSCTTANNCGQNFMQDQYNSGEPPFTSEIGPNALMSSTTFTGCPGWDSGCSTNPLANLNAGANPPGAAANNGETPYNNVWSSNTYSGPWSFWAYIYGNCGGGGVYMPSDGSNSLGPSACSDTYPQWQNDWQQDSGSTYNPLVVNLHGVSANQEIHGSSQTIGAYEDTISPNTISSTLKVNGTSTSTLTSGPYNFTLNTLGYRDGPYTLQVTGSDSGGFSNSDSQSVYVANGDLNGDGHINLSDLAVMAAHWGQADSNYADGNITGQGTINISDLAVLAANWGWAQ